MDQLDFELDVKVADLKVLRDVRRVDLLLLTAELVLLEAVVEVVAGCRSVDYLLGLLVLAGLLLLDYPVPHFQRAHCLLD